MEKGIGLIGQKVGMTQVFDSEGRAVGVTVIQAGPCTVLGLRRPESHGYSAIQLAFREEAKERRLTKAFAGQFKKLNIPLHRRIEEFRAADLGSLEVGSKLTVEIFNKGERVDVMGTSKGKGFQGVIKRHGFKGGPATHGSMSHRAPGSIGSSTDPGHTLRGTRMGGKMGNQNATSQNLEVIAVDAEKHVLVLKGAVPGAKGSWVRITKSLKKRAPTSRRLVFELRDADGAKTAAKKAVKK